MAVICNDCGREIEKHEPCHMYNKTVGRSRGLFHSSYTMRRVPICEQCWKKRKKRQFGCLLALAIIAAYFCFSCFLAEVIQPGENLSDQESGIKQTSSQVSERSTFIPFVTGISPATATLLSQSNTQAPAAAETYTRTSVLIRVTSNVGTYVRNGPGVEYNIAGLAEADQIFNSVAYHTNTNGDIWYLIEIDSGKFAWVSEWVSSPEGIVELAAIPTAATVPPTPTQKPVIQIGETIAEFNKDNPGLSLTVLSWRESDIAVDGPYVSGYYTFTATPGMKFVILIFQFQNNSNRPQNTPYLDTGEILTDKGYFYPVWHPPSGANSEEYDPRKATGYELQTLGGNSATYEELLPEDSIAGRIVFEIPQGEIPIEAHIKSLSYPVNLAE